MISPIEDEGRRVLQALASMSSPASNKDICSEAELDAKTVTKQIKKLKDAGYVDSPIRCKYGITESGRGEL